jgi:hypothetical protein
VIGIELLELDLTLPRALISILPHVPRDPQQTVRVVTGEAGAALASRGPAAYCGLEADARSAPF